MDADPSIALECRGHVGNFLPIHHGGLEVECDVGDVTIVPYAIIDPPIRHHVSAWEVETDSLVGLLDVFQQYLLDPSRPCGHALNMVVRGIQQL
jgi:hypothetical protein